MSLDLWKNSHVKGNKGQHPVPASLHVWLSIFFFFYWIADITSSILLGIPVIFSSFVWVITIGKEFDYYKFSI